MTAARARIVDAIVEVPGIHFSDLVRRLDLAPGQVQHHLRRLLGEDAVRVERLYGRTHYYPPSFDGWERRALSLLRRETSRDVVVFLLARGPSRPHEVADGLDIARSTLEWQLDRLIEQGLVEKHRDDRNHVTLVAARPAETIALLATVEPTLPDRLVDRFVRLLDSLFAV